MNSEPTSEQFRLFVAIRVPDQVKEALARIQAELRRTVPETAIRWTSPQQMHLTLRFLGNVDSSRVRALADALTAACRNFAPLALTAEKIGFFPNNRVPRVVWAGVRDSTEQLPRVQPAIDAATREFTAEPPENKFTGHLTLGRIKLLRQPETGALARAAATSAETGFGQWTANSIELIRSELSPQGAKYTTLAEIPLVPAPPAVA